MYVTHLFFHYNIYNFKDSPLQENAAECDIDWQQKLWSLSIIPHGILTLLLNLLFQENTR